MKEELESIEKNQTYELVGLPQEKKPIGVKWMYKVKAYLKEGVVKHKARFVVKGFLKNERIQF